MKDFAMRHQFITLFIVSDLFVCVQNCVAIAFHKNEAVRENPTHKIINDTVDKAEGTVVDIKEALNESVKSDDISE